MRAEQAGDDCRICTVRGIEVPGKVLTAYEQDDNRRIGRLYESIDRGG